MEVQEAANIEVFCKLKNALGHFRDREFPLAIQSYEEALSFVPESPGFQQLRLSTLSLRAAALTQEGQYQEALEVVTLALNLNKSHQLSLLRRAKIYLKLGQIDKGVEDLEAFMELAPDLQTGELINQFQCMIDGLQESEQKYNLRKRVTELKPHGLEEEQLLLSFCKLKLIDRKSKVLPTTPKKDSVYFGQESIFAIQADETDNDNQKSERTSYTTQMKKEKIQRQIEEESSLERYPDSNIKVITTPDKQKRRTILKTNPSSIIQIPSTLQINSEMSQPASIVDVLKVKDIDGKLIQKTKSEIKFRQSQFVGNSDNKSRKSILKCRQSEIVSLPRRKSGFCDIKNIDGKILTDSMLNNADMPKSNRSIDSDEEFNIYGNSKMSDDEMKTIVSQWITVDPNSSKKGSHSSVRKSVLKPKSSVIVGRQKGEKRRTVLFKQ